MPVHNAERFLDESLRSVLSQTFTDFELVALENGSTDGSRAVLRRYADSDPRVRVVESDRRLGLVGSSNAAVAEASAPLVARMDADDVIHPERLERQHAVLARRPDVVAVGSLSDGIDTRGRPVLPRNRWRLIRCAEAPFPHGSTMFRRDVFDRIGGYCPGLGSRDIDMLLRLWDQGPVLVLPEPLYTYRYNASSSSLSFSSAQVAETVGDLSRSFAERRAGRPAGRDSAHPDDQPDGLGSLAAALHAQGALRLWAGAKPGVVRELIRMGFRLDRAWQQTLLWAAWGEASPGTLRWALRTTVRVKDHLAAPRYRDGRAYEWRLQ